METMTMFVGMIWGALVSIFGFSRNWPLPIILIAAGTSFILIFLFLVVVASVYGDSIVKNW